MNISCVICQELIDQSTSSDIVIVTCGHLFHSHCLYQWLERSKSCPQCRKPTKEKHITKVFFTIAATASKQYDCEQLTFKLDSANWDIQLKTKEIASYKEQVEKLESVNRELRLMVKDLENKQIANNGNMLALKEQIKHMSSDLKNMNKLRVENDKLTEELDTLESIKNIVQSTLPEVNEMLKYNQSPKALATMVVTLKREMEQQRLKRNKQKSYIQKLETQVRKLESGKASSENADMQISNLEKQLMLCKHKNESLKRKLEESEQSESPEKQEKVRKVIDVTKKQISPPSAIGKITFRKTNDESSSSPYLSLKSSQVGPKTVFTHRKIKSSDQTFSILKNPQIAKKTDDFQPLPSQAFNGLGGHPSCDFPLVKISHPKKPHIKRLVRPEKPNQSLEFYMTKN